MDIQKLIQMALTKLQADDALMAKFKADPVKTMESLLNVDLPDEQINAVIQAVKASLLGGDKAGLGGLGNVLGGLFGKK